MAGKPRLKATGRQVRHAALQELIVVRVLVDRGDKALIRAVAETLRGEPDKAKALRAALDSALADPEVKTAFDIFGSDLPDEVFSGVFDQR